MAVTEYGVNHPLAVKLWSKRLLREALKQTYVSRFMGRTANSLVYVKDEASKSAGDRITCGLRMQLTGAGISGDETLEGNEEALTTYSDNIFIDQLRHAVRSKGKMSEQRVNHSVREEARSGLSDWLADRLDTWFFNQACGNTAVSDTKYTGLQAAIAPTDSATASSDRHLFHDGTHTTEASLSTTDTFILPLIDRAITVAKTATPRIRPIRYQGGEYFVMFLHPYQVYNLRTDASTARITWFDAQKARVQGGLDQGESPIFNGALGMYNGVILHESTRVTNGVTAGAAETDVRRAVLCGAQSVLFGMGQTENPDEPNWYEELFDYGNQLGVKAGIIGGMKKAVFNSIDFGTVVVSTYAVAP
jgi:N4-gp56 family major capsid protein